MIIETIQQPDKNYLELQAEMRSKMERLERCGDMRVELQRRFMAAFKLKRMARNTFFDEACINRMSVFLPDFINHARGYKLEGCLFHPTRLILSQPYVKMTESAWDMVKMIQPVGVQVVDLTSWSFHYPGRTAAIGFLFTAKAKRALELAIEAEEETARALAQFQVFES